MPSSGMLRRVAVVRTVVLGVTYRLHHQGEKSSVLTRVYQRRHSSYILVNLMMETVRSSDSSVLTRLTRRHITEGEILQSLRS
jgi:hypothetical protein